MESIGKNYINSTLQQFRYYRSVGEKSIAQINDNDIHWQCTNESNSVVTIVKHIAGNSLSRWPDFFNY